MSMSRAFHIDEDELIQYALGALGEAQLTTLTAHVSMCTECRAKLAAVQVELAAYASVLPVEEELPQGARDRFLSRLNSAAQPESRLEQVREEGRTRQFTSTLREWFSTPMPLKILSGALALATLFLAYDDLGHIHENRQMIPEMKRLVKESAEYEDLKQFLRGNDTQEVTLHEKPLANKAPEGHAIYSSTSGRLVFTAANMPALPPSKAYELWLLPASGAAPIPAGTFVPDRAGNGAVIFPNLPENTPAGGFGITVEDAEGATKPTPPILLSGQ
jgi:DNA-binding transcriptional regulator YbjK